MQQQPAVEELWSRDLADAIERHLLAESALWLRALSQETSSRLEENPARPPMRYLAMQGLVDGD